MDKVGLVVLVTWKTKFKKNFYSFARNFKDIYIVVHKEDKDLFLERNPKLKGLKYNLIFHTLQSDFSALRNLAHSQASTEYLFHLDSDEEVVILNRTKFEKLLANPRREVYLVRRKERFLGQVLRFGESTVFHSRLVKTALRWKGKVHEEITSKERERVSSFYLLHDSDISIHKFIEKLNYYSDLRVRDLKENGMKGSILKIIFYPLAKFLQDLFWRKGLLDGWRGIFQAFLMAYYSLIVQVKLFLRGINEGKSA